MSGFVATSFAFPTVVLTVVLAVAVVLWVASLVGLGTSDGELDVGTGAGTGTPLALLHLDGAPLTVSLTLWSLFAWFTCFTASALTALSPPDDLLEGALATGLLLLSLAVGLVPAALVARPVGRLVRRMSGDGGADGAALVGRSCRITTRTVTPTFGQAVVTLADGTTDTIQVRVPPPGGVLAPDDTALVVHFDPDDRSYLVEPAPALLGGDGPASADPSS